MAKEEDPKPSHQLYKLQKKIHILTRQTLSMESIKEYWELPQKKIVLIAVDIGSKNIEEQDQIRI